MKKLYDSLLISVLRWFLNGFLWVYSFLLESPPENSNGVPLDPELHAYVSFLGPFDPYRLTKNGLDRGRAISSWGMRITGPPAANLPSIEDRTISGPDSEIPIRVYDPDPSRELPGCVFYHGGGFVLGDLDSHDGFCRMLARESECRVISVDYRLAPEHRFPAAIEDAVASYRWVREHSRKLNIDPDRLVVAGDSAGGTLATIVCQQQIQKDKPTPDRQFLIYPMTDQLEDYPSRHQENEQILLTWDGAEWFGEQYVSEGDVDSLEDPRISPLRFNQLEKMPPTLIATAGFDPLRDEALAYADRLKKEKVEVQHEHYENLVHGFVTFAGVSGKGQYACEELTQAFKESWE